MENPPHIYPFKPWTCGDELMSSNSKSRMTLLIFQEMDFGNFGCPFVKFLEGRIAETRQFIWTGTESCRRSDWLLLVQPLEWQGKFTGNCFPSSELQTLELLAKTCLCLSCTWKSCYPTLGEQKKKSRMLQMFFVSSILSLTIVPCCSPIFFKQGMATKWPLASVFQH